MRLITPEYGLLAWSIFSLLLLVLFVLAAIRILGNGMLTPIEKLGLVTFVFFIPLVGPLVYFTANRSRTSNKYV